MVPGPTARSKQNSACGMCVVSKRSPRLSPGCGVVGTRTGKSSSSVLQSGALLAVVQIIAESISGDRAHFQTIGYVQDHLLEGRGEVRPCPSLQQKCAPASQPWRLLLISRIGVTDLAALGWWHHWWLMLEMEANKSAEAWAASQRKGSSPLLCCARLLACLGGQLVLQRFWRTALRCAVKGGLLHMCSRAASLLL